MCTAPGTVGREIIRCPSLSLYQARLQYAYEQASPGIVANTLQTGATIEANRTGPRKRHRQTCGKKHLTTTIRGRLLLRLNDAECVRFIEPVTRNFRSPDPSSNLKTHHTFITRPPQLAAIGRRPTPIHSSLVDLAKELALCHVAIMHSTLSQMTCQLAHSPRRACE